MKHSRFFFVLLCAAISFVLASCNANETTTTGSDSSTMTTDTTQSSAATSTVVTTPENMMVVVHKVADYTRWKTSYDNHDSLRTVNGIRSYVIGRGVPDSNMVLVAVKPSDVEKAKAFAKDPSLKKAMQEGGVTGTPNITIVNTVWQDTATLSTSLRSRTSFTVKDWAAWETSFLGGRQERLDNGIVDRLYGHDVDDNKKVSLVVAITDTAKAFSYFKSDALKKRRQEGGVVGEPQRFIFNVVQRY